MQDPCHAFIVGFLWFYTFAHIAQKHIQGLSGKGTVFFYVLLTTTYIILTFDTYYDIRHSNFRYIPRHTSFQHPVHTTTYIIPTSGIIIWQFHIP